MAARRGRPLRVMFQDEARFGRINEPRRCWAAAGVRPVVCKQIVREYTYAYAAVSPADGVADFLILPEMTAVVMNVFLAHVANCHPHDFILMCYDGAPCHSVSALDVPPNMMIESLPAYCPELNPTENIWDNLRETFFPNVLFDSLDALENQLVVGMRHFAHHADSVRSITGFPWIISNLLNAN
jgi:hypothetical protein